MNNLNSILIEGNMVREPLYRTTPKGTPVCTFSLASNRFFKQDTAMEKEVSFFEVETWSKLADACSNLGKKGRGVRVVGRLKQDRWTGNDGKNHSKIRIVADHVEFRPEFRRDAPEDPGNMDGGAGIDGEDIALATQRYHDDARRTEYDESQAMANIPASIMF